MTLQLNYHLDTLHLQSSTFYMERNGVTIDTVQICCFHNFPALFVLVKDWGPWKLWTFHSLGVQAVLRSDFSEAQAVQRFDAVRQKVQRLGFRKKNTLKPVVFFWGVHSRS